ncbi:MarR family transcriptional regulator [Micromonospora sp. NPDC049230]|uniref:MarR family winged helix-turn-helix transcriptional regulator n=1 Tax=unclassified Micromonospora TaxID=2617518 RepID=UPI0033DF7386
MSREPQAAAGGPISHAVFRLSRAHRLLAGRLLRDLGLHPGQELIMMYLWERGPVRQSELADRLQLGDSAGTTRRVQRLERAGYVRRVPDPSDGRATLVESTESGRALRPRIEAIWTELETKTVAGMTDAEQRAVLAALERMEDNVGRT